MPTQVIGQTRLIPRLNELLTTNKFPQAVMLTGPKGSGKEVVMIHVANFWDIDYLHYSAPKVDEVREIIEAVKTLPEPTIFLIADAHKMNQSAQNALLKTLEEPPHNAYFVLTSESEEAVLPTIRSRCAVHEMDVYTPQELAMATDDQTLLSLCSNIGQIKRAQSVDINGMLETAQNVVEYLGRISAANTFNVLHHIANAEDYDLFLDCILYAYKERAKEHDVTKELKIIAMHRRLFRLPAINKTNALEIMLMDLRRARLWNSKHSGNN